MLRSILILPLVLLSVQATGKFSILKHPASLEFKGNEKLDSLFVGDVLGASMGLYVDTESKWGGLYINDPFELPRSVFNVIVDGVSELHLNQKTKSFPLSGDSARYSLELISSTIQAENLPTVNVDLDGGIDSLLTYTNVLGNLQIPTASKYTGNLKPDIYPEDKLFLQQLAAIKALSNKMSDIADKSIFIVIHLSLKPLIDVHGINSPAVAEVLKTLSEALVNLGDESSKAYENKLLFTLITGENVNAAVSRQKRQAEKPDITKEDKAKYNLATYYNENYPVIFNIILWFMVVFVFALLAISYVIGTMDPGRDSIIYRMTSTRMKKDN